MPYACPEGLKLQAAWYQAVADANKDKSKKNLERRRETAEWYAQHRHTCPECVEYFLSQVREKESA